MWIMTNFGAFMPALRPPKTVEDGDPQTLQIRARRREHLDRLREYYMPDLGSTYEIAHSDYEYRANATPAGFAAAMVKIALDIDYVSFKHTTATQWGDKELETAYLKIWHAINEALAPPADSTQLPHTYQPGRRYRPNRAERRAERNRQAGQRDSLFRVGWAEEASNDIAERGDLAEEPFYVAVRTPFCDVDGATGECLTLYHRHDGPVADPSEARVVQTAKPALTGWDILGLAPNAPCPHEAWECDAQGRAVRCADCLHVFSLAEVAQREAGGPVEVGGRLSHSGCDHANSKNARARCRRRFLRGDK